MSPKPCVTVSASGVYYRSLISVTLQVVRVFIFTFVKRILLFFDFLDPFDESGLEFVSSSKTSSSADGLRSKFPVMRYLEMVFRVTKSANLFY